MSKTGNRTVIRTARNVSLQHNRRQRGVVLAMSLIFLLMLTLLAVVSMGTGTLQQKMAGNSRDMDIAFQSAESTLSFGERTVSALNSGNTSHPACADNTNGIWCFGGVDWTNLSWWLANSIPYMNDGTKQIQEAYEEPRVIIEQLAANEGLDGTEPDKLMSPDSEGKPGAKYYRVTARGVGVSGISESVTESFYRVWKPEL